MLYKLFAVAALLAGNALAQVPIEGDVFCGDRFLVSTPGRPNNANPRNSPAPDVVFRWHYTNGPWSISTCSPNTQFDTWLHLYADASLTQLLYTQDDTNCSVNGLWSQLRPGIEAGPPLVPGTTYYIVVDGFSTNQGTAELSINCNVRDLDCGNCDESRPAETGCGVSTVEACVCAVDPFCCDVQWDSFCSSAVTDVCDFNCTGPPPLCDTEPQVANAQPFTTCAGTPSGGTCVEAPICDAGFTPWGTESVCFGGAWTVQPGCIRPASVYGHLWFLTLDNVLLAYHKTAILRLWASEANDMELQARTLRPSGVPCDASIIGQIALRAADQLITVVGSQDVFEIRFNGVSQILSPGDEHILGTGPDQLTVELSSNTSLSIVSKRGAVFNIIFYETPGMSWLAVPHSLNPAAFYGNTQGLLGVYDGDGSNDFTLRNGTVLPVLSLTESNGEQVVFGDSWVLNSSESLFGVRENLIADLDPEYSANLPGSPSIPCDMDFSNFSIPECDALDPQLIDACYFDVVYGGPVFLDDILYQPACGNNSDQFCSFHGACENDVCVCSAGWTGDDCEIRICPTACIDSANSTGACRADGVCDCLEGFTGATCEESADCSALNDCHAADGGGVCVDNGVCECASPAYDPVDCEIPSVPPYTIPPTVIPTPAPTCEHDVDDNLEVRFPPLLDDDGTFVQFNGNGSADMVVSIYVPIQYDTVAFSFTGASSPAGGFDSETSLNNYWTADTESDLCNTIYTGIIPWDLFRTSLGGVVETVTTSATSFATEIGINVTRPLTLTPQTKLLLQADQQHTRTVRLKVPFEVTFERLLTLDNSIVIPSNELRLEAALIETSVLDVIPTGSPLANARFEVITIIPLPLRLDPNPTITVTDAALGDGLAVRELSGLADCDVDNAFCTQHWEVLVSPNKCDLTANYTINFSAFCHDARNCVHPAVDSEDVVLQVASDSFCLVTQEVTVQGTLDLAPTECNDYLQGSVTVSNVDGAQFNRTEIIEVLAHPPLANPYILVDEPRYVTVFEEGVSPTVDLDYNANEVSGNQATFEFLWRGSELRCDVEATVHVVVRVTYQATRDLSLLELAGFDKKNLKAGELFTKTTLMKITDADANGATDQTVRMTSGVAIGADANTVGSNGGEGNNGTPTGGMDVTTLIIIAASVLVVVIIAVVITVVIAKRRIRNKAAEAAGNNQVTAAPKTAVTPTI